MLEFALALFAFLAVHVLPRASRLRDRLAARIGERAYRIGYSVVSLGLLAWVVGAALEAPHVALWTPGRFAYWVPLAVMPVALTLLVAGSLAPNPLSIAFRSQGYSPERPGIVGVTRHPVLWGFGLWALCHIPANGDVISVTLFGSLALFGFAGMAGVERRARRHLGSEWPGLSSSTSLVPRIPLDVPVRSWLDGNMILGVSLGLTAYAGLLAGIHLWAMGADPLAGL